MNELAVQDKTLYTISDDLSAWFESREMVAAQLGEPQQDDDKAALTTQLMEIDGELARLGAELAAKTDTIAGVLRRMATEQDRLKAEQERIHGRRKGFERAESWLRNYVVGVMRQRGIKQLRTEQNTLFIRQSDAVVVEDSELLPEEYKNVTVKMPAWLWRKIAEGMTCEGIPAPIIEGVRSLRVAEDISLSTIKKAIKSGIAVNGADIEFHDSLVLR